MGTHPIFESDFDCLTERERAFEKMETDTLVTPDKKSQQRQKRLLALNAEDQQSYEKKVKKLKKKGTPGKKKRASFTSAICTTSSPSASCAVTLGSLDTFHECVCHARERPETVADLASSSLMI